MRTDQPDGPPVSTVFRLKDGSTVLQDRDGDLWHVILADSRYVWARGLTAVAVFITIHLNHEALRMVLKDRHRG